MAAKLFPTNKKELISHLKDILKSIPAEKQGMRQECAQLIQQLEENTPNYPSNSKTAQKENREFLLGGKNNIGVYHHFDVTTPKVAKKPSTK